MKIEVRADLIHKRRMITGTGMGLNINSILMHHNTPMTKLHGRLTIKIKMHTQITVQI